ncbi:TPA: hypothetical protein QDZ42_003975 [Stenotrophomonas maltophilia]|nr:hypothetical protein [Stenotrophomonas maltophilia]HDS1045289.1 hypothetical protein [Stenotrophomonas maltophilia]
MPRGQGGKIPVDTGFLRNSATASIKGMPGDAALPQAMVFATMELAQTAWTDWTEKYSMRMEHGFFGENALGRTYVQAGKGLARAAAQCWDFIVAGITAAVKGRMGCATPRSMTHSPPSWVSSRARRA